jgi:acyl-CoA synthetase (AMP-forming)/AMP-acid ligase II
VGAPDPEWGERVVALVVLMDESITLDLEALRSDLQSHAAERLAGYKRPREYHFVNELPYSATGKLLRAQLRARFWQGRERQI